MGYRWTTVLLNLHGGLHGVQMDYITPESAWWTAWGTDGLHYS